MGLGGEQKPTIKTILSKAFEGDLPPPELSAAIVSLVELAQIAMPDPNRVRQAILGADFASHDEEISRSGGEIYGFEKNMLSDPVTGLKHEFFERERNGAPVFLLLSVGMAGTRPVVFLSTLFQGAIEADVVKAVTHVAKREPFVGAKATNASGFPLRRIFWDVEDVSGVRFLVASGPPNVDGTSFPRAITAISIAAASKR